MVRKFKPTVFQLRGDVARAAEYRNFAEKILEQSKQRNEVVGNYANSTYRFVDAEKEVTVISLLGYDIIQIFVPLFGQQEQPETLHIYSGLVEPRTSLSGLDWYLRYWPSNYELYNPNQTLPKGLASSVNGANVLPEMPPNRWMYNDYDELDGRKEMPWFAKGKVPDKWLVAFTAGRFSGQLRKLVQLQLGMGITPGFDARFSGLRLETLDSGKIRMWLYEISAGAGIRMQLMEDYSPTSFERENNLRTGTLPTEIEEAGFFSFKSSFDNTRDEYTKLEYDALIPKPSLRNVTFKLLDASVYNAAIDGFDAQGDYGWSFNSTCTRAVVVGIGWNRPPSGDPAVNYKSQLFTLVIDEYKIAVFGGGAVPFLMASSADHIKFPNSIGELDSKYFWRGENGSAGTQPSSSYSAPMYAYYDLTDLLQIVQYKFKARKQMTPSGGGWRGWDDTIACRTLSQLPGGTLTNFTYENCDTGRDGTGFDGEAHGFVSTIAGADDEVYAFSGGETKWTGVTKLPGWGQSGLATFDGGGNTIYAAVPIAWQSVEIIDANFSSGSFAVLVIPSFERLGYYHFKSYTESKTEGRKTHESGYLEIGSATREMSTGVLDKCDQIQGQTCPSGTTEPEAGTRPETWGAYIRWGALAWAGTYVQFPPTNCGVDNHPCWIEDRDVGPDTPSTPPDEDPFDEVSTTVSGGLLTPHGDLVIFSEADINASNPFRESSSDFGKQSVVSAFDTFSNQYVFSLPDVGITVIQSDLAGEFDTDFLKVAVAFTGAPYYR